MESRAAHSQSAVKIVSSFVSINGGLLQGKCYVHYYHAGMWSFIHLRNVVKAFFGGQLWGEQFGSQEAGVTASTCGIARR